MFVSLLKHENYEGEGEGRRARGIEAQHAKAVSAIFIPNLYSSVGQLGPVGVVGVDKECITVYSSPSEAEGQCRAGKKERQVSSLDSLLFIRYTDHASRYLAHATRAGTALWTLRLEPKP